MMAASIPVATGRGTRIPVASKDKPEEYKSIMIPPTSPKIATIAKGTKNQVGKIVVKAPIGSEFINSPSFLSEPTSNIPKIAKITHGSEELKVVQKLLL